MNSEKLSNNMNQFSFKLFNSLSKDKNENFFISPLSISTALTMTYTGADSETAEQIKTALCLNSLTREQILEMSREYISRLHKTIGNDVSLKLANKIFSNENHQLLGEFSGYLQKYFESETEGLNFSKSAQSAKHINDWVSKQTEDKINDLISADILNEMTKLVLVNAIYFKGTWANKFNKDQTYKDDFILKDGSSVKVDMMKLTDKKFRFKRNPAGLMALTCEFPYAGKSTAMTIILPHEGVDISEVENQINGDKLNEIFDYPPMPGPVPVHAYIPRFKMDYKNELSDCLKSLGVTHAFDETKADFSLMSPNSKGVFISKVIHQSMVEVSEKGTEAAAATAVVMMKRSLMTFDFPPEEFKCNRPFLFIIHETESNGILFMGKCMSPSTH